MSETKRKAYSITQESLADYEEALWRSILLRDARSTRESNELSDDSDGNNNSSEDLVLDLSFLDTPEAEKSADSTRTPRHLLKESPNRDPERSPLPPVSPSSRRLTQLSSPRARLISPRFSPTALSPRNFVFDSVRFPSRLDDEWKHGESTQPVIKQESPPSSVLRNPNPESPVIKSLTSGLAELQLDSAKKDRVRLSVLSPATSAVEDESLRKVKEVFSRGDDKVIFGQMKEVCAALDLPFLWKRLIWEDCFAENAVDCTANVLHFCQLEKLLYRMVSASYDDATRLIFFLTNGSRRFAVAADFEPLIRDVIETLPSLEHLRGAPHFHEYYIKMVTCRMFWKANCSWKGQITAHDLRRSGILENIRSLEKAVEADGCFNYEHFYVTYCKFADLGNAGPLTEERLASYEDGALTDIVISRILSGAVIKNVPADGNKPSMDFVNFAYFLFAEVDKSHPSSIEFWFRVMDLDGDGRISIFEMEQFYSGILAKMAAAEIEAMTFKDMICLLLDAVQPRDNNYITLADIKRRRSLAPYFFNTFVNWTKHYAQECTEIVEKKEDEWETYCALEHETLVTLNEAMDTDEDSDELDAEIKEIEYDLDTDGMSMEM